MPPEALRLCIVSEDKVSALSGSVSLLEGHVVHLEQWVPATTIAGAGPPQKKRMNGGRRTGCGHGGGGHLFNWLCRVNVFIPLHVFHIKKGSISSNGAARHCWYRIFIDEICAVGSVNGGCSKDRKNCLL